MLSCFSLKASFNESKENFYFKKKYIQNYLKNPSTFKYIVNLYKKTRLNKKKLFFVEKKSDYKINKKKIYNYFADDIQKVERLLNKDLTIWKY